MESSRLPKQVLAWEPPIKRTKLGRPVTSWKNTIERDLKDIGINWNEATTAAKDRKNWSRIIVPQYTNWCSVK